MNEAVTTATSSTALNLKRLGSFMRQPVDSFFREQLGVHLRPLEAALSDDEPFALDGLDETLLLKQLIADLPALAAGEGGVGGAGGEGDDTPWRAALRPQLLARAQALARRGELPVAELGERWQARFMAWSEPMCVQWQLLQARWPEPARARPLHFETTSNPAHEGVVLDDWLDELRQQPDGGLIWLALEARRLCRPPGKTPGPLEPEPFKLLQPWLRLLVASACDVPVSACVVGRDAVLTLQAPPPHLARQTLSALLSAWQHGMQQPLRVAARSAVGWEQAWQRALQKQSDDDECLRRAGDAARTVYDGAQSGPNGRPESSEPALARLFPDWDAMTAEAEPVPGVNVTGSSRVAAGDEAPVTEAAAVAEGDSGGGRGPGRFADWAQILYGPLILWVAQSVQAEALPQAWAGDEGGEPGDAAGEGGFDD